MVRSSLTTQLFNAGIRPAVDPGISVSRVGGAAQTKIIKKLSGGIRTALAQYRELAAFAQFSSDLDDATRKQLSHGQKVTELMKQKQYAPMSVAQQALVLFAAERGYLEDVELNKIGDFEAALLSYANNEHADLMAEVNAKQITTMISLPSVCIDCSTASKRLIPGNNAAAVRQPLMWRVSNGRRKKRYAIKSPV